jgi:hypothetical protein
MSRCSRVGADRRLAPAAFGRPADLTARLTQAPVSGVAQENRKSQLNDYDELGRLKSTEVGELNAQLTGIVGAPFRADAWTLDLLGNWVGRAASGTTGPPGRASTGYVDPNPSITALDLTHSINERNQISQLSKTLGSGAPSTAACLYDAAGNLGFDGEFFYQYDAWNRLVQINRGTQLRRTLNPASQNSTGPGMRTRVWPLLLRRAAFGSPVGSGDAWHGAGLRRGQSGKSRLAGLLSRSTARIRNP